MYITLVRGKVILVRGRSDARRKIDEQGGSCGEGWVDTTRWKTLRVRKMGFGLDRRFCKRYVG